MQNEAIFEIYCEYMKIIGINGSNIKIENYEPEIEDSGALPISEGNAWLVPPGCFTLNINEKELHLYWTGEVCIEILNCQVIMARDMPN